jgi:serine phosphatase RsbU (regulator of sigma subunit)
MTARPAANTTPGVPPATSIAAHLVALSGATSAGAVFEAFVAATRSVFGARGVLALDTRDLAPGEFRLTHHIAPNGRNLVEAPTPPAHENAAYGGAVSEAIAEGEPRLFASFDVRDDAFFGNQLLTYRSGIAAPMLEAGKAAGWVFLLGLQPRSFTEADLERLALWVGALGFARRAAELAAQVREQEASARREGERLAAVQRAVQPSDLRPLRGVDGAHSHERRDAVARDVFMTFALEADPLKLGRDDTRWGMLLADVSAEGAASALAMAALHAAIRSFSFSGRTPADLLSLLNARLFALRMDGVTARAFAGFYDPASRRLDYACAGLPPGQLRRPPLRGEVAVTRLESPAAAALGATPDAAYRTLTAALAPDDTILLVTDGVTEATNGEGKAFGIDRVEEALRFSSGGPADVIERLLRALRNHEANVTIGDDQTIVALNIKY